MRGKVWLQPTDSKNQRKGYTMATKKLPITNVQRRILLKLDKHLNSNPRKVAIYFAALCHTEIWKDVTRREAELIHKVRVSLAGQIGRDRNNKPIFILSEKGGSRGFNPDDCYNDCVEAGFDAHLGITGLALYAARFAPEMEEEV